MATTITAPDLNAATLRKMVLENTSFYKNAAWLNLREGDEVSVKSSDGQMFPGYVYGFETTPAGRLAIIDFD